MDDVPEFWAQREYLDGRGASFMTLRSLFSSVESRADSYSFLLILIKSQALQNGRLLPRAGIDECQELQLSFRR